jgi:hypothetical protein
MILGTFGAILSLGFMAFGNWAGGFWHIYTLLALRDKRSRAREHDEESERHRGLAERPSVGGGRSKPQGGWAGKYWHSSTEDQSVLRWMAL